MNKPVFMKRKRTLERTFRKKVMKHLKGLPEVTDIIPMTGVGKGRPDLLVEVDSKLHFYLELKGEGTGHDVTEEQMAFASERGVACGYISPDLEWQEGIRVLIDLVRDEEFSEGSQIPILDVD